MNRRLSIGALCTAGITPRRSFAQVSAADLTVVIVRHGEKPPEGDNLSCQGFNRSRLLPPVLYKTCGGAPDYTYVPSINAGEKTSSVRMLQTVTPFAVQHNLTIDSRYAETDTKNVAQDVLRKKGVVLMVWEHSNIPGLARDLGVTDKDLSWNASDFDSIWIVRFAASVPALTRTHQGLKPSASCG